MTYGQLYVLLCIVLLLAVIALFWFAGPLWGVGIAFICAAVLVGIYGLGRWLQQRIDDRFRSY